MTSAAVESPSPSTAPPLRRVLVVSPHFPPNAPDHQRIRTALPYLREFGWQAHILAVQPDQVEHPQDALLEATLPSGVAVTRTTALPNHLTRKLGLGNLGLRCLPFFQKEGDRLLSTQSFDLVFFSTTIFPVMALGRCWLQKFGVPYVVDFQDPWRVDASPTHDRPGGRLKYAINKLLATVLEPPTLRQVSHIVSVSPAYPDTLKRRYLHLHDDQFSVLPFGAPEQDFQQLPALNIRQRIFDPQGGNRHWVYVGRGGTDMAMALRSLFLAIGKERDRNPEPWRSVRLHFVGTSYAQGDRATYTVQGVAQECGVADLVSEHPHRIPYFEALQLLADSDAILLIGSHDASYTASKLYPCLLAHKPILAVFHERSSVVSILHQCRGGHAVPFNADDTAEDLMLRLEAPLNQLLNASPTTLDWDAFQAYTAREMTRKLCDVFDRSVSLVEEAS